jgi:hypothetical protein
MWVSYALNFSISSQEKFEFLHKKVAKKAGGVDGDDANGKGAGGDDANGEDAGGEDEVSFPSAENMPF